MRTVRIIMAGIFGGCYSFAAMQAFLGNIPLSLGVFILGTSVAVLYLSSWMVE